MRKDDSVTRRNGSTTRAATAVRTTVVSEYWPTGEISIEQENGND